MQVAAPRKPYLNNEFKLTIVNMFAAENIEYSLLLRNGRNRSFWHIDIKTVLMIGCLIFPITLFCGTYMILFGIYEKLAYPKSYLDTFYQNDILRHNLYRADAYNKYSVADVQNTPKTHAHDTKNKIDKFKLVCYYNFPSDERSMQIDEIDPSLCTHLNVGFASVQNHSIYLDQRGLGYLQKSIDLKKENPKLMVLLSVGGAGNNMGYPDMVKNHTNRKTFIKSLHDLIKIYSIDGIDLDWEFPGSDISYDPNQRMHFTQLLREIRNSINTHPKYKCLLTIAVAAPTNIVDVAYDVSYMNKYVDHVNIMSYDYHFYTKITPFTGINSPLYKISSERFYPSTLNINYSSHYWNLLGMEKNKIVIGLPTYGHTFRLLNPKNHDFYAPASGYGKLGNSGFASFPSIYNFLQNNHITAVFNMETFSPYASKYYEWVSFDDPRSLTYKSEFIKANNFGGAMVYSLNTDDYKGVCNLTPGRNVKFPLIKAIKSVFDKLNV